MTSEQLWALRKQIVLNSLYYSDYRNTFGIDCRVVCDFFDSYLSYLEELMADDSADYTDEDFFALLPRYDTPDNLWNWYGCYESDPLPRETRQETDAA